MQHLTERVKVLCVLHNKQYIIVCVVLALSSVWKMYISILSLCVRPSM